MAWPFPAIAAPLVDGKVTRRWRDSARHNDQKLLTASAISALIDCRRHSERYTKNELLRAFSEAGFRDSAFERFAWLYFWLDRAN